MSLWKIALRSLQERGLASFLTGLSMALGVSLVVAVLTVLGTVSDSFRSGAGLGYNLVVGPKGSSLDLVLNTVYYLKRPIGKLPYSYYQQFQTGEFKKYTDLAVPVCLGDYLEDFRVVGTTPEYFTGLQIDQGPLKFSAGGPFTTEWKKENVFSGVIGSTVARQLGLKVGSQFQPSHSAPGETAHKHDPFTIVGILAPTGTPIDRGVFINLEGFYLLDDHAKPVTADAAHEHTDHDDDHDHAAPHADAADHDHDAHDHATADHDHEEHAAAAPDHDAHDLADHHDDDDDHEHADHAHDEHDAEAHHHHHVFDKPLPDNQREVTAILVRSGGIAGSLGPLLKKTIDEGNLAQAAMPIREIGELLDVFVRPIQWLLLGLAVLIVLVAGIGILVSMYNSMHQRRREIAIMRALGAGRGTVMNVVLLESLLLALVGGVAGWLLGHGLIAAIGPALAERTGVSIGFGHWATFPLSLGNSVYRVPYEAVIIPALALLAALVGWIPGLMAYRTDVSKTLSAGQ
jgi:putative ABC transport system permease protein